MVEVLEVKQGVWIDETLIKLAGLGTRLRVLTQPGEIRIVQAQEERPAQLIENADAWAIFQELGQTAPRGKLANAAEDHDRYLYGR